jgi:hypothetical protein
MRAAITACAALLAGCDLIFVLDDPTTPATPVVTGKALVRTVEYDPDQSVTLIDTPADNTLLMVHFDDDTALNVAVQPNGSFEFERSSDAYRLEIIRGADVLELFENAPELVLRFAFVGRDDAAPFTTPIPPTTIRFPATAAISPVIVTTGQWTQTSLKGTGRILDWKQAVPTGHRALGLIDSRDFVYYLEIGADALAAGQTAIAQYAIATFDMVEHTEEDLSTSMLMPAVANGCVRIDLQMGAAETRLTEIAASSPGYGAVGGTWGVSVTPAIETVLLGGVGLVGPTTIPTKLDFDTPVDALLFDPFPNQKILAGTGVGATRRIAHPGAASTDTTLTMGINYLVPTGHSLACAENAVELRSAMAFADTIAIDGKVIDVDDAVVTLSGAATITWNADSGDVDFFDVALREVVIDSSSTTQLRPIRVFRSRDRRLTIDESLLEPGHRYVISVSAVLGFPKAADGDYQTTTYPVGNTTTNTPMFQVE